MPGGVLALDCGRRLGWAFAPAEACRRWPVVPMQWRTFDRTGIASGQIDIASASAPLGAKYAGMFRAVQDLIVLHDPKHVVTEAPLLATVGRGGQRGGSVATARALLGYAAVVELVTALRGREPFEVFHSTVKKHFTGSGRAEKKDTIAVARERGFDPGSDNEADALAVLDYAVFTLTANRSTLAA